MNDFTKQILEFEKESTELQEQEEMLKTKGRLFNEKFHGFLKSQGLPDNFTLPQLLILAIRKARD